MVLSERLGHRVSHGNDFFFLSGDSFDRRIVLVSGAFAINLSHLSDGEGGLYLLLDIVNLYDFHLEGIVDILKFSDSFLSSFDLFIID